MGFGSMKIKILKSAKEDLKDGFHFYIQGDAHISRGTPHISRGTPMKICVSYPVDVCCVIFYAKKSRVNQNIEMLLMPLFFRLLFFTHPKSGFGLRLGETVPARYALFLC